MRNLFSELLLAQIKKVKSECFATLNANVTEGKRACPLITCEGNMNNIEFYQVNNDYIDYLLPYAPHLFHNKKRMCI